jgi:hypothetical protein
MSEKTILTIAYSAVSALGLWLIIDVGGWIATIAGAGLVFFAGAGLAGMATFGSVERGRNYLKGGKHDLSFKLSSVKFANQFNNFSINLSDREINEVYAAGQTIAPLMKYTTSYNMPRVIVSEIGFPFCAVGEFSLLFNILEHRGDAEQIHLLEEAVEEFKNEFEDEIENLDFHLSR